MMRPLTDEMADNNLVFGYGNFVGTAHHNPVIPANAGIQGNGHGVCGPWTPAFAGATHQALRGGAWRKKEAAPKGGFRSVSS